MNIHVVSAQTAAAVPDCPHEGSTTQHACCYFLKIIIIVHTLRTFLLFSHFVLQRVKKIIQHKNNLLTTEAGRKSRQQTFIIT